MAERNQVVKDATTVFSAGLAEGTYTDAQPNRGELHKNMLEIPNEERWLHTSEMRAKIARARKWFSENPPCETDLDSLESRLLNSGYLAYLSGQLLCEVFPSSRIRSRLD